MLPSIKLQEKKSQMPMPPLTPVKHAVQAMVYKFCFCSGKVFLEAKITQSLS